MERNEENVIKNKKVRFFLVIFKFVFKILGILFPFLQIVKCNKLLQRAARAQGGDHPYFFRQRILNWIFVFITVTPLFFGTLFSYHTITSNKLITKISKQIKTKAFPSSIYYANPISYVSAYRSFNAKIDKLYTEAKYKKYVEKYEPRENLDLAFNLIMFGLLTNLILGSIIVYRHPIIVNTKKLTKYLYKYNLIDRENKDPLVLATPLGYLIDITGTEPKIVAENKSVWMALNVRIDSFEEDPDQRSIVFFNKAYQLKETYIYKYDDKGKPKA